jgi:hypothetical protein
MPNALRVHEWRELSRMVVTKKPENDRYCKKTNQTKDMQKFQSALLVESKFTKFGNPKKMCHIKYDSIQ